MSDALDNEDFKPVPLQTKPGVKRDGTMTEGDWYTEAKWARVNALGKMQKMGGYRRSTNNLTGPVYGIEVDVLNGQAYIRTGSASRLEVQLTDLFGNPASSPIDQSPVGLITDPNNIWQLDAIYDTDESNGVLLAHTAPNLSDISSSSERDTYFGALSATTALVNTGAPAMSGGVCALPPYAFVYGNNGKLNWSDAGVVTEWAMGDAGSAQVAKSKIVRGMVIRGSDGNSPAGLFFSLNSVVRATWTGDTQNIFNFNTIADGLTPVSSRGFVEDNGIVYWVAQGRFMAYNGVVQELENPLNIDYFFDNLKASNAQKVWATKVPRWGEIWFFFPLGNSVHCNHAVVYNRRTRTWYDTPVPEDGRSDGYFPTTLNHPMWVGVQPEEATGAYDLWQHEYSSNGQQIYDKIVGNQTLAVDSFVTTQDISLAAAGKNSNISLFQLQPDINQTGDMTVQAISRPYPRGSDIVNAAVPMSATAATVDSIRMQGRFVRLIFRSNVAGGFFQMGDSYLQLGEGDERPVGA